MYEIQHQTQHLWEAAPRWNLISRHATLERCVLGCKRILTPMAGQGAPWSSDDLRIARFDAKRRLIGTFDHAGNEIHATKAKVAA